MDPSQVIHTFLDSVSRRLRHRAAWTGLFYLIAFLGLLALLSPLLSNWAQLDRSSLWIWTALAVIALTVVGLASFALPRRRWKGQKASARFVGEQVGTLASDLLSTVELIEDSTHATVGQGSLELRQALFQQTAKRLGDVAIGALVPFSTVRRAIYIFVAVAILHVAAVGLAPGVLRTGWARMFSKAPVAAFDGANLADHPLVGDLDILVEFPSYTGKSSLQLPSSSGDFEAMPGSTVSISTRAIGPVVQARILLSDSQALLHNDAIEFSSTAGGLLRASMQVTAETYYRFSIDDGDARHVESRAHHIAIRSDKYPSVELYAPADELDVAKVKRVELAYVASDDFGIDKLELVYQAKGGTPYRVQLLNPALGDSSKNPQGKYLWDLGQVPLRPGVQIEYHLEVTDNDSVLGPNTSKSASFKLRLYSPRERHEDLITRQHRLAEHMLQLLGQRLLGTQADYAQHRLVHRRASEISVEFGGLLADLKSDEMASVALIGAIVAIRDRMSTRLQAENKLLSELEAKERNSPSTELPANKRLQDSDKKMTAELEDDLLSISDWLQRQDLENLLGISDEIKAGQERLAKLFKEYERTGDPQLLEEIERELKALEKRLQELATKSTSMPEDVLDRFVNSEALQQEQESSCLDKVRALLRIGDAKAAQTQMERCSQEMDSSASTREDALKQLRGETFSEEERAFNEVMNDLSDLGQDQQEIADAAEQIYERYAEAASQMQDTQGVEARKSASDTLQKLRKKLRQIPESGLTAFAKEELGILKARLDDTARMLDRGDLAEALSMARHAHRSLRTVQDELELELDEAWSRQAVVAEKLARNALPTARRLVEELTEATPSPSDIMSKVDRKKLDKLRRQQKNARSRGQRLLKKITAASKKLPGKAGVPLQEGLELSLKHMKQAAASMQKRDPSGARDEAQQAAKKLQNAQKSAQAAARQKQKLGQQSWRDEPIRIPGAEDYKAPELLRKQIMDAMNDNEAPLGFSKQLKRYYKDIIQ